jgi:hypothetical protein
MAMRPIFVFLAIFASGIGLQPSFSKANDETASTVSGRVTDHSGRPLPGTEVSLSCDGHFVSRSLTNSRGAYLFKAVAPGDCVVSANLKGFLPSTDHIYIGPREEAVLDLGLEVGAFAPADCTMEVSGIVRQRNGGAIADATVTFANAFNRQYVKQYRTDGQGRFRLEVSEYGQYFVYGNKPGFEIALSSLIFSPKSPRSDICRVEQKMSLVLNPLAISKLNHISSTPLLGNHRPTRSGRDFQLQQPADGDGHRIQRSQRDYRSRCGGL